MSKRRRSAWLLLILLAAAFLRLHELSDVPPGMTHDEADHGVDAWDVVQGERPLYFTVGYGREPLFDYSTAVLMSFLGPTYLAGRLTAVFFSLILVAGTFAWARQAFPARIALLTVAGLAVSFWPVMTGRHALRSVSLPALFVLAAACFWRGLAQTERAPGPRPLAPFAAAGGLLGLTFYTYIPARILWLIFPVLLLYLWWVRRPVPWRGAALTLLLAGAVAAPLFVYLHTHPGVEMRIGQLAAPLQEASEGNFEPLFANVTGGLKLITQEGDSQWRYNVAGRPLLPPLVGILFYAGLLWATARVALCLWRRAAPACRQAPAFFLALAWLAAGLSPALVTGPELSTTQAIGMQPVLYLFPAVALAALAERVRVPRRPATVAALLFFAALFANTARTYFAVWATHPQVQIQYEANLVEVIAYVNEAGAGTFAISTDAPGRFHDPATAQMFLRNEAVALRWFDGRHSLLFPGDGGRLIFTPAAPLHPALGAYLPPPRPSTGAEPALTVYDINSVGELQALYPQFSREINNFSTELSTDVVFGDAVAFLGYHLQTPHVTAGEVVQLATLWQVQRALPAGAVLFTHVLARDGRLLAQADRLDAPSFFWRPGDIIVQLHEITLPGELAAGAYRLATGVYFPPDRRLPLTIDGTPSGDVLTLSSLTVD